MGRFDKMLVRGHGASRPCVALASLRKSVSKPARRTFPLVHPLLITSVFASGSAIGISSCLICSDSKADSPPLGVDGRPGETAHKEILLGDHFFIISSRRVRTNISGCRNSETGGIYPHFPAVPDSRLTWESGSGSSPCPAFSPGLGKK